MPQTDETQGRFTFYQSKIQTFQKYVHLISIDQNKGDSDSRIKSSIKRIHAK